MLDTKLGPAAGVPRHRPGLLAEVKSEVLHLLLELVQGGGLGPDPVGDGLGPEGEVQGVEVGAVGRPVVLEVLREKTLWPNLLARKARTSGMQ